MTINFMSSKDTGEECVMHSKNYNREIMTFDKADKVEKKPELWWIKNKFSPLDEK